MQFNKKIDLVDSEVNMTITCYLTKYTFFHPFQTLTLTIFCKFSYNYQTETSIFGNIKNMSISLEDNIFFSVCLPHTFYGSPYFLVLLMKFRKFFTQSLIHIERKRRKTNLILSISIKIINIESIDNHIKKNICYKN